MDARLAGARWKAKIASYVQLVSSEVVAAESIHTVAAGRAALELAEERWEQITDAHVKLEIEWPEPDDPENLPPDIALIFIQ